MRRNTLRFMAVAMIGLTLAGRATGQGMAVNTDGSPANASAILDVTSSSQGMLVPRMTLSQRTGISSPATGLLVYQTDGSTGFWYNSGTPGTPVWVSLNASNNASITIQGNTFNGSSQLVQTNGSGQLPAISGANLTNLSAANLTGTLPAISGANLTSLPAANLTGTLPAISGANLTSLPAGNLTGTLPAISGANLTSLPAGNLTGTLPAISGANLTSLSGTQLTNGTVAIGKINTSAGTASSNTFLRGDGTWSTPLTLTTTGSSGAATYTGGVLNIPTPAGGGGGATLVVNATNTTSQIIPYNGVSTPLVFGTYSAPATGTFDGTTFTATQAGNYLVCVSVGGTSTVAASFLILMVNGANYAYSSSWNNTNIGSVGSRANLSFVVPLAVDGTMRINIQNPNSIAANTIPLTTDGTTRLTITKL